MNNILIISEINDYLHSKKMHFSLTKGYEFAKGLSKYTNNVDYLTLGKTLIEENLKLINIEEITDQYLETVGFVILIRETNILDIFDKSPNLKN